MFSRGVLGQPCAGAILEPPYLPAMWSAMTLLHALPRLIAAIALTIGLSLPGCARAEDFTLIVLGDSLSAGFGLENPDTLVERIEAGLAEAGLAIDAINAGVSGDTAAQGRARFNWSVGPDADGVLIELGANDMFAGRDPAAVKADLAAMIEAARDRGLWVGLVGMRAPRNAGPEYRTAFDGLYPELSVEYDVPLYPFYFDGLIDGETGAREDDLFLRDGIHPTTEGVTIVADRLSAWLANNLPRAEGDA